MQFVPVLPFGRLLLLTLWCDITDDIFTGGIRIAIPWCFWCKRCSSILLTFGTYLTGGTIATAIVETDWLMLSAVLLCHLLSCPVFRLSRRQSFTYRRRGTILRTWCCLMRWKCCYMCLTVMPLSLTTANVLSLICRAFTVDEHLCSHCDVVCLLCAISRCDAAMPFHFFIWPTWRLPSVCHSPWYTAEQPIPMPRLCIYDEVLLFMPWLLFWCCHMNRWPHW